MKEPIGGALPMRAQGELRRIEQLSKTIGGSFGQCAASRKSHQTDLSKKVPQTNLRTGTRVAVKEQP
jgi:hypothetical protein